MEGKRQKDKEQKTDRKEFAQKKKEHQAVLLKYPKNIRQVGESGGEKRIYVEDYVMTMMMYLAGKTKDGYGSAILLGKKAVVEGQGTLFISGAVEILQKWKRPEEISSAQWTGIYDQIQKYFQQTEILGWFLTHPGMELEPDEEIRCVWRSCFDGAGEVLLLYDNISREEAFYACKDGEFEKQPGYYIYYEKNEEMQNYMIEVKGGKSSDEGYHDAASEKIRRKFERKQEMQKRNLLHQQAAYTAGILAGAVVLAAAAGNLRARSETGSLADSTQEVETLSKKNEWILGEGQKTEETAETAGTEENEGAAEKGKAEGESGEEKKTTEEESREGKTTEGENEERKTTEEESEEGKTEESGTEGENGEKKKTTEEESKEEGKAEEIVESGGEKETENQTESSQSEFETEGTSDGEEKQIQTLTGTEQETAQTEEQEMTQENAGKTTASTGRKKKRYKVKKGDTLESISITWYGNSSYVKKIKRINRLENADKIYIGQVLILP